LVCCLQNILFYQISCFSNSLATVKDGCSTTSPPATTTSTVEPNKPAHVSDLFHDRHVMDAADFNTFYQHANDSSLTNTEITALENWRK